MSCAAGLEMLRIGRHTNWLPSGAVGRSMPEDIDESCGSVFMESAPAPNKHGYDVNEYITQRGRRARGNMVQKGRAQLLNELAASWSNLCRSSKCRRNDDPPVALFFLFFLHLRVQCDNERCRPNTIRVKWSKNKFANDKRTGVGRAPAELKRVESHLREEERGRGGVAKGIDVPGLAGDHGGTAELRLQRVSKRASKWVGE